MNQANENSFKIEFLYKALEDAQNTIRFTDTKAGLVLVGLTIIATFMGDFCSTLIDLMIIPLNFLILCKITAAVIAIVSFIISAFIIFKAINPLSSPTDHVILENYSVSIPFYLFSISPKMGWKDSLIELDKSKLDYSVKDLCNLYNSATEDDIIGSLTYELTKVSYIREKKIFRVNKAISFFKVGIIFWIASMILFKCLL